MSFKEARKNAGMKINEAADLLHVSRVSLYKWENGQALPESSRLLEIAQLYKTTVDELLRDNGGE